MTKALSDGLRVAALDPVADIGDASDLGICISGGGSRALSCALGQLSALTALSKNAGFEKLLAPTSFLSSVSGGSWASVPYVFFDDAEGAFLRPVQPPDALYLGPDSDTSPANMAWMASNCLGSVPQNFASPVGAVAEILWDIFDMSFHASLGIKLRVAGASALVARRPEEIQDTVASNWSVFWIALVGRLVLAPFNLYSNVKDKTYADRTFTSSAAYFESTIQRNNPGAWEPGDFYVCQVPRPNLIVNFNLLQTDDPNGVQIPVRAMPSGTGISGESPDQTLVGNGSVDSFAFGSSLVSSGAGTATVGFQNFYSLCDIAGCSSAFFAANLSYILDPVQDEITESFTQFIMKALGVSHSLANSWSKKIVGWLFDAIDHVQDDLTPRFNYWPIGGNPPGAEHKFSDGGDFDNSGVLGVLGQPQVTRIVAFDNCDTAISKVGSDVIVSASLPQLFGYAPYAPGAGYVPYSSDDPMRNVQVFDDSSGDFRTMIDGLYDANAGRTSAAFCRMTLTTVENKVAAVEAGRKIDVFWICNTVVTDWQNAIKDPHILALLASGQASPPSGALKNFPNFSTIDVGMPAVAVNMLSQLSGWVVESLETEIGAFLAP